MAKNNSKISVTSLDKLLKELNTDISTVTLRAETESIDIEVRRTVSLQEFCEMVDEAAYSYFQYDGSGQEYYVAGLGDFACDYVLLKHLTNLKTAEDVEGTEKQTDRLYALCVHTDLMRRVEEALPQKLVLDFREAVYHQVTFHKRQMLSQEKKALNDAIGLLDKATETFTKFTELFQDVDPGDMMAAMQRISAMDEGELAKAVVNARDKDFVEQRQAKLEVVK